MNNENFKKKTQQISLISRFLAMLSCFAGLFMPFATGLKSVISSESGSVITNYGPAFSFMFGGKIYARNTSYNVNGVSIIALIAYMLLILSLLLLILFFILRKKAKSKFLILGSSIASLVSAILALCSHSSAATTLADSILGRHADSVVQTMIRTTTLQFGFWGISLFGFLALFFSLASLLFDGTFEQIKSKIVNK